MPTKRSPMRCAVDSPGHAADHLPPRVSGRGAVLLGETFPVGRARPRSHDRHGRNIGPVTASEQPSGSARESFDALPHRHLIEHRSIVARRIRAGDEEPDARFGELVGTLDGRYAHRCPNRLG